MKTAIYLRTSTEEQNPENQKQDCISLAKKLDIKEFEVIEEKQSAWKDDFKRDKFQLIKNEIKKRKIGTLIVWDLDRIYRNRKNLVAFFKFCKIYRCRIYSFRQQFLEDINKAPEPWNEMLFDNMVFILGWIAEEESSKKSERVRAALRKDKRGKTISKYGNVWGHPRLPDKARKKIVELHEQGKNYREICQEVYYWSKSGNKKYVSLGMVHKTISGLKGKKVVYNKFHN